MGMGRERWVFMYLYSNEIQLYMFTLHITTNSTNDLIEVDRYHSHGVHTIHPTRISNYNKTLPSPAFQSDPTQPDQCLNL